MRQQRGDKHAVQSVRQNMPSPWQLAQQFQVQQATNTSTFARHQMN
jgi:hypothetical protein